ncbi:MAG TPA: Gfo/Idh/MocA family oxidoreductase, partial [Gaiellaceae bacterium]|nr:Gfo/Idh/MocA family oxidoreductase [Gaiellaceae bacterium]
MAPLRIGLLSTARIGGAIVDGSRRSSVAEVVAVASRDAARAEAYAREHAIPRAHGAYEALLADPEVDAVYVALPPALHVPWSERALEAGKHVLVEKPLSRDPAAVERLFDAAERAGLVVIEGFMWRHQPQAKRLQELARGGAIGELRLVRAHFSGMLDRPGDPRWDPALGGGTLLDMG